MAFSQVFGHMGVNSRMPILAWTKKIQVETKKMTGYGTRFRCAEIVDTVFLKGHVVDPAQARIYRLVSNVLNILLKNGPNRDRAIRLRSMVGPGNGGPVARVKEALNSLSIAWTTDEQNQTILGGEVLKEDTIGKILHLVRDKLRRIAWRKAATRRNDMVGLEDLNYEKSRALWKKKCLNSHLQRTLEYVLSNAVWFRERNFRHTGGRGASSPKCTFCDSDEDETHEHIYWKCKKWDDIREKFPLAKKVYEETQYAVTKTCGLVPGVKISPHQRMR